MQYNARPKVKQVSRSLRSSFKTSGMVTKSLIPDLTMTTITKIETIITDEITDATISNSVDRFEFPNA